MKILVACEYSNTVSKEFRKLGHTVISCDLLPNDEDQTNHYQGDVFDIINDGFDMMIAHPPCTHLAVSGAAWFKNKINEQKEALEFVRKLMNANIKKICIENPVSVISTYIRKPDQIIHPYYYGDPERKRTCLWLKNLPKLYYGDNIVKPQIIYHPNGKTDSSWHYKTISLPSEERRKIRSKTFVGIAQAMASQWGNSNNINYNLEQYDLFGRVA